MPYNVAAYYRFSSDNLHQVDNSEDRQQDAVERVIFSNKEWRLVDSFTDEAVSGTDDKPELMRLKFLVETDQVKIDILCVDDLSRLTRRSLREIGKDVDWLEQHNIRLSIASKNNGRPISITEMDDDLTHLVEGWQNNQQPKKLSRSVTNGIKTLWEKDNLGWYGRAPYGFDLVRLLDQKTTIKNNSDCKIVREVFDHFLAGNSIRSCIKIMEQMKYYQDNPGRGASMTGVRNVLRASIYAGIRTLGVRAVGKHSTISKHKKSWTSQNPLVQAEYYREYKAEGFEPIITLEEYQKVQSILDQKQKSMRRSDPGRHKHFYSGVFRCGKCGTPMVSTAYKNERTGKETRKYYCQRSGDGSRVCREESAPHRKGIRTDEANLMINQAIVNLFCRSDFHFHNLEKVVALLARKNEIVGNRVDLDLEMQQRRLDDLVEMFSATGSQSLKEQIVKQAKILDEAKQKHADARVTDGLLEFAENQYLKLNDGGLLFGYLGRIYGYAVHCVEETNTVEEREVWLKQRARELSDMFLGIIAECSIAIDKGREQSGMEPLNLNLDQMRINLSPEECLRFLREAGLSHIVVDFQLGEFRGKASMRPQSIGLCFLLDGGVHKSTLLVLTPDQISIQQL